MPPQLSWTRNGLDLLHFRSRKERRPRSAASLPLVGIGAVSAIPVAGNNGGRAERCQLGRGWVSCRVQSACRRGLRCAGLRLRHAAWWCAASRAEETAWARWSSTASGAGAGWRVGDVDYEIFRLAAVDGADRLPFSLKVLLENLLRTEDGRNITADDIRALAAWDPGAEPSTEIQFTPARVLLQDFTGVPAMVDLATMREAMRDLGGDPSKINPLVPVELVIDHSVIADVFGAPDAFARNVEIEYERNRERYQFLRWGQGAFDRFKVVPPGTGIVHQVNIEHLARVVFVRDDVATAEGGSVPQAYPDTLVGTDSHTPMVNGLGVLGWGVGGIEAEAAMLGQPVSMLIPQVVGVKLTGELPEGSTATDLVLTITEQLRAARGGRQVRRVLRTGRRRGAGGEPGDAGQHEPGVRQHLRDLPDRRRDAALPAAHRAPSGAGRPGRGLRQGAGPVARPAAGARLLRAPGAGPVDRRPVAGRPEAAAGPGPAVRGQGRVPRLAGPPRRRRRHRRRRPPAGRAQPGHPLRRAERARPGLGRLVPGQRPACGVVRPAPAHPAARPPTPSPAGSGPAARPGCGSRTVARSTSTTARS